MSYTVELIPTLENGARDVMWRCGIEFKLREPQVLDLSDEQLEVFENDWRFKVSKGEKAKSAKTSESETVVSADDSRTQSRLVDEVEAVEDKIVASKKTRSRKGKKQKTLASLLQTYNREELDELARGNGVDSPEFLASKAEVAQAILDVT